ncbi:hypothetical protein [Pseudomonas syringae]|uniref:hypothetical protein n=1 Tax=Pseudomonas TaxID=286 RepID=UPI00041FB9C4|nr:hypothetical protein [Pseudomonas syringae]QGG73887.1 hypothetical protein N028_00140 [Pseudomonas syringae USA011]
MHKVTRQLQAGVTNDLHSREFLAKLEGRFRARNSPSGIVTGEGEESVIMIKFSFPKLDENKLVEQAKKPAEYL